MSSHIPVMILEHSCCMLTVHKSLKNFDNPTERREDCGDAYFQYDLGDIKKTQIKLHLYSFFFKRTLKFEDAMILVTLRTKRWDTFKTELSGWIRFVVGICVTQY